MQGSIISIASKGGQGVILGDDGVHYTYTPAGWRDISLRATPGMRVDFEVRGSHAVGIYPMLGMAPTAPASVNLQGTILSLSGAGYTGVITGDDGIQYTLTPGDWGDRLMRPTVGMRVNFVGHGTLATEIYPVHTAAHAPPVGSHPTAPYSPSAATPLASTSPVPPAAPPSPPQHPSPTPAATGSHSKILAGVLVAAVLVGVAAVGAFFLLQERVTEEETAAEVAREWSSSSIDEASEVVMGLLVGNLPVVAQIGGAALADKIRQEVRWSYSTPECGDGGHCEVTATAAANLDINVPLVLNETATIRMPFLLDIDTGEERVTVWNADLGSASVSGVELGSVGRDLGQGINQVFESSDVEIMRAVEKLQEFATYEDVVMPGIDLIQFSEDLIDVSDEVDRAIQDFDLDQFSDDVSDEVDKAIQDFDLDQFSDDVSDEVDRAFRDFDTDFGDASDSISDAMDSLFGN